MCTIVTVVATAQLSALDASLSAIQVDPSQPLRLGHIHVYTHQTTTTTTTTYTLTHTHTNTHTHTHARMYPPIPQAAAAAVAAAAGNVVPGHPSDDVRGGEGERSVVRPTDPIDSANINDTTSTNNTNVTDNPLTTPKAYNLTTATRLLPPTIKQHHSCQAPPATRRCGCCRPCTATEPRRYRGKRRGSEGRVRWVGGWWDGAHSHTDTLTYAKPHTRLTPGFLGGPGGDAQGALYLQTSLAPTCVCVSAFVCACV